MIASRPAIISGNDDQERQYKFDNNHAEIYEAGNTRCAENQNYPDAATPGQRTAKCQATTTSPL